MNATALEGLILRELPAARDGDTAAFSRIVAASQNAITAIALAITRDVATSEDIAQEAFLNAWQNLRRLQNPASFLPWLRQIARNLARDHLRSGTRRRNEVADAEAVIAVVADPGPSPCERLIDDECQRMAADLISALPDDSREVLLLYYREGQRSQQVAFLLGLSDAAVRKRLSRARAAVRDELLARFGEFARDTAPSAAFTTMVATALTMASPPAAAAGLLTIGGAAGAKTFGKLLFGTTGAVGAVLLLTFGSMWIGLKRQLRGAVDDAERAALKRHAAINAGLSIGFVASTLVISHLNRGWVLVLPLAIAFTGIIGWRCVVIEPRILARRHAIEALRDPIGAARRRRREHLMRWGGIVLGTVGALAGIHGRARDERAAVMEARRVAGPMHQRRPRGCRSAFVRWPSRSSSRNAKRSASRGIEVCTSARLRRPSRLRSAAVNFCSNCCWRSARPSARRCSACTRSSLRTR